MTSDDWKRVEELFDEALEKREEDRTQWLELECDDPLIRAEVIDMLAGHAMAGGVLEEEAQDFASDLILKGIEEEEAVHRKRVGPYKLVREIGAGGMGKVFLGVRDDGQFDQDVAVKLLRPGLVTEQINKRFLAERQILAGFRHPNIARLYDGGVLDDGTPYFIMEYVEGSTITEYCVENGLTLDRRLELFLQVCDAVAHAHQKLVVHRDLKPSNIMVTKAGRVKLLDFGIAKLLDSSDGSEQVAVTQTGLHLLTPEYASPEQINGELISTSSDVYQLGVILYEMLAEQRPYRFESRALSEITRVVLEQEPARPSTLFKKDSAVISAPQSPRRWMHRLRGDLDAITLTALRKDPSARYASVDQLSADVRRYKDGQPVQARERSVGYRARKFVRRYRWQVAVAFVIAVYAVTVTVQQASTARERDRAERYANFMTSLFASPDPFGDQAKTDQRGITVQEFLDQALLRLDQELAADPVVHADLLTTIGQVYSGLGSDDKAAIQFEQALSINRVLYGDESAETIQTMRLLASSTSDRQVADSMFQTQLKLAYEVDGGSGLVTGRSLIGYGHFLVGQGRLEDADSLLTEAIVIGTEHGDEDPEFRADAAYYAGQVSGTLGELDRADSLLTEAVEIRRETYGGDHPATGTAMTALAYIAKNKGEYDRAERLQRGALILFEERLGVNHPVTIGTLNNLALILSNVGDHTSAEEAMRDVVARLIDRDGVEDPETIGSMQNLATFLMRQGRFEEAEPMFLEVHQLYKESLLPGHYMIAYPLLSLTDMYLQTGDYRAAESTGREVVDHLESTLPEGHMTTAISKSRLGEASTKLGKYSVAEPLLLDSYQTLSVSEGSGEYLVRARERLLALYEVWGRPREADRYRAGTAE